jgi:hypothetical protein
VWKRKMMVNPEKKKESRKCFFFKSQKKEQNADRNVSVMNYSHESSFQRGEQSKNRNSYHVNFGNIFGICCFLLISEDSLKEVIENKIIIIEFQRK